MIHRMAKTYGVDDLIGLTINQPDQAAFAVRHHQLIGRRQIGHCKPMAKTADTMNPRSTAEIEYLDCLLILRCKK